MLRNGGRGLPPSDALTKVRGDAKPLNRSFFGKGSQTDYLKIEGGHVTMNGEFFIMVRVMENKTRREIDEENLMELSEALARLRAPEEVRRFIEEVWTDSECRDVARRWHLMKLLAVGVPQREIAQRLKLSLCKITRGSKYIKDDTSLFRKAVMRTVEKEGENFVPRR